MVSSYLVGSLMRAYTKWMLLCKNERSCSTLGVRGTRLWSRPKVNKPEDFVLRQPSADDSIFFLSPHLFHHVFIVIKYFNFIIALGNYQWCGCLRCVFGGKILCVTTNPANLTHPSAYPPFYCVYYISSFLCPSLAWRDFLSLFQAVGCVEKQQQLIVSQ